MLTLQGLLTVTRKHQDEADDPAPGPDLLGLLPALPRRRDLHASPRRALHCLLRPRAHRHLGGHLSQGPHQFSKSCDLSFAGHWSYPGV